MDKALEILIIDDDIDYANFIFDVTQLLNLNCAITTNAEGFMNRLDTSIDLVFLDLNIPNIDGIELLQFIENKHNQCHIILMSGVEDRILEAAEAYAQSIGLSVVGRFQKTIRLVQLEDLLKKCTDQLAQIQPKLNEKIVEPEFIVTKEELLRAIQEKEFVVFYQPKIDIKTRGFCGVEALIRWFHPVQKLIFPDQFIHIAETVGLIDEVGWIAIQKALDEIGNLQHETRFPFKLSLNLAPQSLKDLEFPNKFISYVEQSKILQENIIFEITESELINELSSALAIFTRLRLNKIQLSIDDFGTGYSMMQQLKIIPANELKVDKSFVHHMLVENSARVTVQKVIEIGHALGMKVVAEGVETKEQLQFLQNHNCDIAQGYYFSKPIPIAELKTWINEKYGGFLQPNA